MDWKAPFERHGEQKLARIFTLSQRTLPIGQTEVRQGLFAGIRHGWKEIGRRIVPSKEGRVGFATKPLRTICNEQRASASVRRQEPARARQMTEYRLRLFVLAIHQTVAIECTSVWAGH